METKKMWIDSNNALGIKCYTYFKPSTYWKNIYFCSLKLSFQTVQVFSNPNIHFYFLKLFFLCVLSRWLTLSVQTTF